MKRSSAVAVVFVLGSGVVLGTVSAEGTAPSKNRYLLTTTHTPEQCVASLKRIAAHDRELFESMDWGCKAGDHTGYALVSARTPDEAVMRLPDTERTSAKAVMVKRLTVPEAQRMHEKAARPQ